jgi:hypothetical protein
MKILKILGKSTFHKDNNTILITIHQKYPKTKNFIPLRFVKFNDFFQRMDAKVHISVENNATKTILKN